VSEERQTRRRGTRSDYSRAAIEWILIAGFAGIVLAILALAAALVYWAWTA
jgi:hypothetical protein